MKKTLLYSTLFCKPAKCIFAIFAIFVFSNNTSAQSKIVQKKHTTSSIRKKTAELNAVYLSTSFDLNLSRIPVGFRGHNPIELYNNIKKKSIAINKGEFETTAQYEEKIEAESKKPIIGNLYEYSLFTFQSNNIFDLTYDADNQEMEAYITNIKEIELRNRILRKGTYNGTNAFGVSKEIDFEESISHCLSIINCNKFTNLKAVFKISAEKAKQIKEKKLLSVIYIGKLSKPYIQNNYYTNTPTLKDPYDDKKRINYINFELNEIWIYNKISGEIYAKIKQQKDIVCDIKYAIENRILLPTLPLFNTYKFFDGSTITFNVDVSDSGDLIIVKDIVSPTTLNDRFLQDEAKGIISKLRFAPKINNYKYSNGTITLNFKRR